jgi:anti-anti-sigma factor
MTASRDPNLLARGQQTIKARSGELQLSAPDSPRSGGHLVVRLPAEIDITNASQVQDLLAHALTEGAVVVIADATATTFCDCAGVSALIGAHGQSAVDGTRLRVAAGSALLRLLSLTESDRVLEVYQTLAAALAAPLTPTAGQPAGVPASPALNGHRSAGGG